jgi:hypothetical protein
MDMVTAEVSVRVTNAASAQRALLAINERLDAHDSLERRGSAAVRGSLVEVTVGSRKSPEGIRLAVAAAVGAALSRSGTQATGAWVRALPEVKGDQPLSQERFTAASAHLDAAVEELHALRALYLGSGLPESEKRARVAAIGAKLAAIRDLHLNPHAHPWAGDR